MGEKDILTARNSLRPDLSALLSVLILFSKYRIEGEEVAGATLKMLSLLSC